MTEWANEKQKSAHPVSHLKEKIAQEVPQIQNKLDRLLDAHLAALITQSEYLAKKDALLSSQVTLKEKLAKLESGAVSWLEPFRIFLKTARDASELSASGNLESQKNFLKKIGSLTGQSALGFIPHLTAVSFFQ